MTAERDHTGEERLLRSAALQTASSIRKIRQRAEEELARAGAALEARTVELERALRNRQIELAVTQILATTGNVDEAIDSVLEVLRRNLGCACAQFWKVDRQAGELLRAMGVWDDRMSQDDRVALARFDALARGVDLPGRIWQSERPVWIEDLDADGAVLRGRVTRELGLQSAFGFPLVVSGAVPGVIECFSREQRPSDPSVLDMTAVLGSHIGEFIERAAAEAERQRTFEQLRRLQEVTASALESLTLQELFDKLLTKVCHAVESDFAAVFLLDRKANDLYVAAATGAKGGSLKHVRLAFGESLAGRAAAQRTVMLARKATQDPSIRPALRALGAETVLAIPLLARSELVGVLEVGSLSEREFTTPETDFMQHVGHQVAIAIENSSLYEAAREANRIKDRFLSMASHELKTPLNALLGWTEMLRTIDSDAMRKQALEAIDRNVRAQAELIDELLDVTRVREGKLVLHCEDLDLASVVGAALSEIQSVAAKRGVSTAVELPAYAPRVHADPARIRQVVWNLLTNAIKFTPAGKRITTRVGADTATAMITVEDQGEGISPEFLPRIFDELAQEEKGERAGGLGLGLYIVNMIVKLHGGTVHAHSAGVGQGATFVVRLPVVQSAATDAGR